MPRIIVDEFLSIFFILVSFIGVMFKDAVPYNFVTSAFMHADFAHWLSNSMLFAVLSPMVERHYGKAMYLAAFVFTCVADSVYAGVSGNHGIGMSAFVFALFMLNLFAGNRNAFSLCGLFVVVTYGGQELLATGRGDNVGHVNHLVGMVSGAVFGSVHSLFRARLSRFFGKK